MVKEERWREEKKKLNEGNKIILMRVLLLYMCQLLDMFYRFVGDCTGSSKDVVGYLKRVGLIFGE